MTSRIHPYRFELFLFTQMAILFGSLFVPENLFESWISPILLLLNLTIGVVFVAHKKRLYTLILLLLVVSGIIFIYNLFQSEIPKELSLVRLACFFLFYGIVSLEIIGQVAKSKIVEKNVILGLISGYIALGMLAFFMFLTIEIVEPNSFSGLNVLSNSNSGKLSEQLMYFSFVTLLTIGYGEILPTSNLAQKGAVLVALLGQFYLVILTAIVVGKYLNQFQKKQKP